VDRPQAHAIHVLFDHQVAPNDKRASCSALHKVDALDDMVSGEVRELEHSFELRLAAARSARNEHFDACVGRQHGLYLSGGG
jgi:hypothetical protein